MTLLDTNVRIKMFRMTAFNVFLEALCFNVIDYYIWDLQGLSYEHYMDVSPRQLTPTTLKTCNFFTNLI